MKYVWYRLAAVFALLLWFNNSSAYDLPARAYIQHISIDPTNPEILYIATADTGLYKSVNRAQNWQKIDPFAKCHKYYVIEIDPQDPARIYAGGESSGLWVSTDRGDSWRFAGLEGVTIADMAIDPVDPEYIFVLASNGVYRNMDIGHTTWQHVLDYPEIQNKLPAKNALTRPWVYSRFQKIAINPHRRGQIFIGARWEGGYHFSNDGGDSWEHRCISGIFRRADPILFHPNNPEIILLGTHHQGMFKSFNGGASWVTMSRGLQPQVRQPVYGAYLVSGLAMDPSNPDILYTGSDYSNWKSSDGGLTWHELGKSLTCEFARSFAVDPVNPDVVYAGTNVGLYKSTDAGASWQSANRGLPELEVKKVVDLTIDGNRYSYALTDAVPPLFRKSLPGDSNWMSVSWMVYEPAVDLRYDETRAELILSTEHNSYRSRDAGLRWDVPLMSYAPVKSLPLEAPGQNNQVEPERWTLMVDITGDVFFEDTLVDSLYQRPPYVSLQLVTYDYPCDGTVPVWHTNWSRYLKGTLELPMNLTTGDGEHLLYIEVRDFQKNVQVGYAPVNLFTDDTVIVEVSPNTYLPCFGALK